MPTRQFFSKFASLASLLALAACGGGGGATPVVPTPPVVTPPTPATGLDGGGTGSPTDPLAAFTAQLTFQPTAHQGLEVVTLAAVNGVARPTAQASPALTLTRTTTGF
ncbi:MAG: hypothetical protein JNM81_00630, partial [Rhodospirillaceae bacterium]|nr:hypothetical protein [Rhodospirillaceae bacterium]